MLPRFTEEDSLGRVDTSSCVDSHRTVALSQKNSYGTCDCFRAGIILSGNGQIVQVGVTTGKSHGVVIDRVHKRAVEVFAVVTTHQVPVLVVIPFAPH